MPRGLWVLLCELPFLPFFFAISFPPFLVLVQLFRLTPPHSHFLFVSRWDLIDEKLGEKTGAQKGDTIKKYTGELIALKRTSTPEVSFSFGKFSPQKNAKKKEKEREKKTNKKKRKTLYNTYILRRKKGKKTHIHQRYLS